MNLFTCLLAVCLLCFGSFPVWAVAETVNSPTLSRVFVDPQSSLFVQEDGRFVLFHGTSLVRKEDTFPSATPEMIQAYVDLGFNVIRLGWVWNLLEIEPGIYNQTFLFGLRDTVRQLGQAGIRVILDMHQDLWSPLYCGGHGVPEFYAYPDSRFNMSSPFIKNGPKAYPLPAAIPHAYLPDDQWSAPFGLVDEITCWNVSRGLTGWATSYATYALGASVQRFYENADGVLDAFIRMWINVFNFFAAEGDDIYLLGLDIMNEPWLGDILTDPELVIPGVADKRNLIGFYNKVIAALRSAGADKTILFWEPATGGNILGMLPSGFTESPGGADYFNVTACSYHVYCPMLESDMNPSSNPALQAIFESVCDKILNPLQYAIRESDIRRLGGGGMLTEFGSIVKDQYGLDVLNTALAKMDEYFRSWCYWLLSPTPSDLGYGAKELARTYPRLLSGAPLSFSFDNSTAVAKLSWKPPSSSMKAFSLPSEIYVSNLWYPQGVSWSVSPSDSVTIVHDATSQVLTVTHNPSAGGLSQIDLTISPS